MLSKLINYFNRCLFSYWKIYRVFLLLCSLSIGIVTGALVLWFRSFKEPQPSSFQKTETPVQPDPQPQLRDVSEKTPDWSWEEKVRHLIDRQTLSQAFAQAGYRLPKGSYVYAARILPNRVGGLGYVFYEEGQGAFSQDFWPASTVKVLAALGALDFAADQGFSGQATVTFKSKRGKTLFSGRLQEIYKRAIRVSSNADYDRTLQIAGLDRLNQEFLPAAGFPNTILQRFYHSSRLVLNSPTLTFKEGDNKDTVTVASRPFTGRYPQCTRRKNCTNLFELSEAVRRLVLHDEIPEAERFSKLFPADIEGLNDALCSATPSYFAKGATKALGNEPRICHKHGQAPKDYCLDHGIIVPRETNERYLLAVAIPNRAKSPCQKLSDVAEQVLIALRREGIAGIPLQPNAGVGIQIQLDPPPKNASSLARHTITVTAPKAERVELFLDNYSIGEVPPSRGTFVLEVPLKRAGERLLIVQAWQGSNLIGYRSQKVKIDVRE